ncbi:FmdB family zinc ribbon protein [Pseudaquabacterium rugosum]|uniref:Zinc ribbon domain-containing protein n=1 Tax=Pseudaquabacterium rugosum TaxID=2984194 RepID=A0ABU9BA68_9BURK
MPLFDYTCTACGQTFERLVRADTVPSCPHCGSTALDKGLSRIAPHARLPAWRQAMRRQAAAEGLMSHDTPADRARLLK